MMSQATDLKSDSSQQEEEEEESQAQTEENQNIQQDMHQEASPGKQEARRGDLLHIPAHKVGGRSEGWNEELGER